jgi:hypothetical protein
MLRGWIRFRARDVSHPTPCQNVVEGMDLDLDGGEPGNGQTRNEAILISILDINNWVEGDLNLRRANHRIVLSRIQLEPLADTTTLSSLFPGSFTSTETRHYRPTLEFRVNDEPQSFTLYANPTFISAHPCVGTHVMMSCQAEYYRGNIVDVTELRGYIWEGRRVLVINALHDGAEALARAWCAEQGRHAVIRKGPGCCYRCAVTMTGASGLGVKVLIWA